MAAVRDISKGTPISSEVLQEHVSAINSLHEQVFNLSAGISVVYKGVAETPVRVTQGQFYGEVISNVINGGKVSADDTKEWSAIFNPAFADIPSVTATLIAPSLPGVPRTLAAQAANVFITSITASGVSGIIYFPKEGENVTLYVSVSAFGASKI